MKGTVSVSVVMDPGTSLESEIRGLNEYMSVSVPPPNVDSVGIT